MDMCEGLRNGAQNPDPSLDNPRKRDHPSQRCGMSSEGYPMRALHVFACVSLVVTLGYIGVSWAVAGVGLCVFATIALVLVLFGVQF
jgi:hypothetical protein